MSFEPDGTKRGHFSLVFTAIHKVTEDKVVLKFYDPGYGTDEYRLSCFKREPEILKVLKGKKRCLQLVQDLTKFQFNIEISEDKTWPIHSEFFVTECVNEEVDSYFLSQQNYETIQKIKLFRQILLSVKMIHQHDIFHRDIKPDNIRMTDSTMGEVKLIDFGTAAEYASINLLKEYAGQVGHRDYSPPEAFLGFSGERDIAFLADNYALGCLLFELFNTDNYYAKLIEHTSFVKVLHAMNMELSTCGNIDEKRGAYKKMASELNTLFTPPLIDGDGTTLPGSISGLINRVYLQLIAFDFQSRECNLDTALRLLDSSTKILNNYEWEKIREQDERLLGYLSKRGALNA